MGRASFPTSRSGALGPAMIASPWERFVETSLNALIQRPEAAAWAGLHDLHPVGPDRGGPAVMLWLEGVPGLFLVRESKEPRDNRAVLKVHLFPGAEGTVSLNTLLEQPGEAALVSALTVTLGHGDHLTATLSGASEATHVDPRGPVTSAWHAGWRVLDLLARGHALVRKGGPEAAIRRMGAEDTVLRVFFGVPAALPPVNDQWTPPSWWDAPFLGFSVEEGVFRVSPRGDVMRPFHGMGGTETFS